MAALEDGVLGKYGRGSQSVVLLVGWEEGEEGGGKVVVLLLLLFGLGWVGFGGMKEE